MNVLSWNDFLADSPLKGIKCAFTVGVFDGIHLGHLELLKRIINCGAEKTAVFTFSKNPAAVIAGDRFPGDVLTLNQKLSFLKDIGIDDVILIDFSYEFGKLTGEQFFSAIDRNLIPEKIVIGYDFKCGCDNSSTAEDIYRRYSDAEIGAEIVPEFRYRGYTVKSTLLRELIRQGKTEFLADFMYMGYSVDVSGISHITYDGEYYMAARSDVSQILPDYGRFSVRMFQNGTYRDAEAVADIEFFKWKYKA
ncbi:MAG: FAD synthetase family protein [Spirochaetia bacterium]|nr:FAD synthetase family protein [Spirochaetia bacterium]